MAKKKPAEKADGIKGDDLKNAFKARAAKPKVEAPAAKGKTVREVIVLKGVEADMFNKFAQFAEVAEVATANQKATDTAIRPILIRKLLGMWASEGRRIDSPIVRTEDSSASCMLVSTERVSSFRIQPNKDGTPKPFIDMLKESNLPADLIEKLTSEVDEKEVTVIVSPDKIDNEELANKVRKAILDADFTDAEMEIILRNEVEVKVKKGFLDRLPNNCKGKNDEETVNRMEAVLRVMSGIFVPGFRDKEAKDISSAVETVARREKPDTGSTDKEEVVVTEDKLYRLVRNGNLLSVHRISKWDAADDKIESHRVGVKTCTDADHAKNSLRKFKTDRAALETYIKSL